MANFCGKCGSRIDQETSLCPLCDREEFEKRMNEKVLAEQQKSVNISKKKVKKEKNKKASAGKIILCVLMSIFLLFSSLFSVAIISVRRATSETGLRTIFSNVQPSQLINSTIEINYDGEVIDFADFLKKRLEKRYYSATVEKSDIDDFLDRSSIKPYIVQKISLLCNDVFEDKITCIITRQELKDLLESNSDIFYDEVGVDLSDESIEEIVTVMMPIEEGTTFTVNNIMVRYGGEIRVARFGFSYLTFGLLLFLCILLIFLMILNHPSSGILATGIVFIITGCIFSVVTLFVEYTSVLWVGSWLVDSMISKIPQMNLGIYLCLLALGVLIVVTRGIVLLVTKNKKGL